MAEQFEDRELVKKWRAGDQEAARQIYDRYVERLLALARRRLGHRVSSRVDPEDVLQSVFRTFFQRVKAGRFQIDDEDDLCKLLMRITVHKTLRKIAAETAAKRDPRREASTGADSEDRLYDLCDREPTPDEAVDFLDQLEHLLGKFTPQQRQILEMRLQGFNNDEIAQKLGTYDRRIRRVLERIRDMAVEEGLAE
jgi:RNA polymerase sigma factor (sigma-70 family)